MEIWKPLKNFPSYNGSSEGRIMNVKTQRIMKVTVNSKGYARVGLVRNGQRYTVSVHKVIGETFLGEAPGMDIYHKDLNRLNNRIENLEWRCRGEIAKEAFERGTRHAARCTRIRVKETGRVYATVTECAFDLCCDRSEIFKCLSGKRDHVKGYHFERE